MAFKKTPENPTDVKTPEKPKETSQKKDLGVAMPQTVSSQFEEIMRRLRLLEERYSALRKKTQFTEQNMLKDAKDIFIEIKTLNETISDLKNEMTYLNEKIVKIETEIDSSVNKSELNTLSKYIEMWQPMELLTRKEAEDILKR